MDNHASLLQLVDSHTVTDKAGYFRVAPRIEGCSHFDIYRTDQVQLTSTLFGGGDWHWRLTDEAGAMLAECGGYRNRRDCLAAVDALRAEAWSATVSERRGPFEGQLENLDDNC
jgi:uncharacterized protein YegP (UPF0339 family)